MLKVILTHYLFHLFGNDAFHEAHGRFELGDSGAPILWNGISMKLTFAFLRR